MKTIDINFSQGLVKQARAIQLLLLAMVLLAGFASLVLLLKGSVSLAAYVSQHRENQQHLQSGKLDYQGLSGRVAAYMANIPAVVQASSCSQATLHLDEIEHYLPRQARLDRFQFSPAAGVITVSVVTGSSAALSRFVEGIESGGRYADVRVKQKNAKRHRHYEVQYRCAS